MNMTLIAIRARLNHAAFTLTGTLPGTATVGTAYTGTLTLGGTYVGPVTITGLAAWMTYSVSGNTVTIGGTPTTAETDTFTPVATDANGQTAMGSAQSVVVSAASSGLSVVQFVAVPGAASTALVIDATKGWATPASGSILVLFVPFNGATYSPGTGWNVANVTNLSSGRSVLTWWRLANGTESSITLPAAYGMRGASLCEIAGADQTAPIHASSTGISTAGTITPATITPTIPNTLAILSASWNVATAPSAPTYSSGWTVQPAITTVAYFNLFAMTQAQTASLASVSGSITTNVGAPAGGGVLLLIKPA